jgi:outer membrane protein OmpA-like peptidoglycan-associated protein
MREASRSRIVLFSIWVAFGAVSAPACKKKDAGSADAAAKDAAQLLERFKTEVARLQKLTAGLRAQSNALPDELPGVDTVRHDLYTLEEVLGVENGRTQFLAGELTTAAASGKKEEVDKVSSAIKSAIAGCSGVEKRIVEVTHEFVPFERMAGPYRAMVAAGLVFTHPLPTGYEVKARKDGIEQQLITFLDDPKKKADKKTWFTFDSLTFTGDSAQLDVAMSQWQIENVAAILKAYPQVKLEIGGYTGNAGPAAAGKKLSAERAAAVKERLVAAGVGETRLAAAGYGAAKEARVAARVTAK